MPKGKPAITGLNSQGIIDDIFKGAGNKVVHVVRRNVQDAVHAQARLAQREAAALRSTAKSNVAKSKKVGGVKKEFAKEVGIKTGPDGKPLKGPDGKTIRVKPKIKTSNPTKKATKVANKNVSANKMITDINSRTPKRTAERAKAYSSIRDKKMFDARAFFPDDASFQRALKEEAAEIRKGSKTAKSSPKVTNKKKK